MRLLSKTLLLLCFNAFLDAADGSFFKGILRELETEFGFDVELFAMMQMLTGAAAMLFNPCWAVILDQGLLRQRTVLVVTACGWGFISIAIALWANSVALIIGLRFLNQIFLCSGLPVGQSIISSRVPEEHRGAAFSVVGMSASLGVILSSKVSVAMAHQQICGLAGWRVGLFAIGLASLAFACVAACDRVQGVIGKETGQGGGGVVKVAVKNLRIFANISTFWGIALYCCFYQVCNHAMFYCAMWLQYSGVPDSKVGSLLAMGPTGAMVGHILFGFVGDAAHRVWALHGRLYVGQGCCVCIIPTAVALFYLLPPSVGSFVPHGALLFLLGFLEGGWGVGTNRVILTMIVPQTQASSVMAWKNVVEHMFAMSVCPLLVAWVSSSSGYRSSRSSISDMPPWQTRQNATALSWTLTTCVVMAHIAMLGTYCAMHWTVKFDSRSHAASTDDRSPRFCREMKKLSELEYTKIGAAHITYRDALS